MITFSQKYSQSNYKVFSLPTSITEEVRLGYKLCFYKRSNHEEFLRGVKINHKNLVKQAPAYSQLPLSR